MRAGAWFDAVKVIEGCADASNPVSMCSVKRLLNLFGIFLALAWVPITSHCVLEKLPGLQFFQCASDTQQESDCNGDSCAQVETASYKVSKTQTSVPLPPLTVLLQVSLVEILPAQQPLPATAAPPEIPKGWQFSFRTALAPRAPSFVS
jgi:hypothetical protein